MGGFRSKVGDSWDGLEPGGYDFAAYLRRLRNGTDADGPGDSGLETAVMAAIVRAATDMHRLEPLSLNDQVEIKAEEQLKGDNAIITVALINRQRSDIGFPNEARPARDKRALIWHRTSLTNTLIVNMTAAKGWRYSYPTWRDSILKGISTAAENGANIICLGEFDYPPRFPDPKADQRDPAQLYEEEILKIINAAKQPIFLFAGSSHSCRTLEAKFFGADVLEFSAENLGRVFYNDALIEGMWRPSEENPLRIRKATPASKIGERLSRPDGIEISTFKTLFGNILVLICADAYDPAIILEVFSHSAHDEERADIIIVPAYNMSPKFAQVCQLLSLISDSIVILLDVCAESTKAEPKVSSKVWNCGWAPEAENGISAMTDIDVAGVGKLGMCDVDLDTAKDFRTKCGSDKFMPFFSGVRSFVRDQAD